VITPSPLENDVLPLEELSLTAKSDDLSPRRPSSYAWIIGTPKEASTGADFG